VTNSNTPANIEAMLRRGDDEDETTGKGGYRKEPHWNLDEGQESILRFLTDSRDWYRAATHRFFPTKAAPADFEGKWPSVMPATCRKDKALVDAGLYPDGCPVCDSGFKDQYNKPPRPADLRFTLAIEREVVMGDGSDAMGGPAMKGKKGYRDKQVEIPIMDDEGKPTEDKITVPSVVIVSNTMYMMMGALKACGETYETLTDRDYRIKRVKNPNGTGTTYQVFPLDKTPDIAPGTDHWKFYEFAQEAFGISLAELIYRRSTDDYYNRFFLEEDGYTSADIRRASGELAAASKTGPSKSNSSSPTPATAHVPTPDAESLAAMRARISKS
jgi:hypothetical protein